MCRLNTQLCCWGVAAMLLPKTPAGLCDPQHAPGWWKEPCVLGAYRVPAFGVW